MTWQAFWLGWRRDIVRFIGLCAAAVVIGVMINRVVAAGRERITDALPKTVRDVRGLAEAFDADLLAGPRTTGATWTYRTAVAPGQSVWIRDLNGSVTVEPARGDSVLVTAVKTFHRSDSATVKLVAVRGSGGVAICALWDTASHCGPGDESKQSYAQHNDVAVEFTVRLPRGIRIDATTVNGSVRIVGASAPAAGRTVSGEVNVETSRGPVNALSVNGAVHAIIRGFSDTGAVKLTTVNGGVTLELPARLDATVAATTVNGAIESDFPLAQSGKLVAHHATGVIGLGGRQIELRSINGSVRLKRARS